MDPVRMVAERVVRAGILALAGLVAGTAGTASAQTGLVAAYGFEEASGTGVADSSGRGNNGSISGATWTTSGRYGQALSFNGTNAYVEIPDSSSLDLTTGMTLEAWVYPTVQLSNWKAILQKAVDAYLLSASTGGNVVGVGGTFAGSCCTELQGPNALPVNQWTHVAGTYDGASLRLY
ncbi:MAG: LamG domain-containing protein, partial [Deltaproteobacteria bacterium]